MFGNTAVELQLGVLRLVRPGRLAAHAADQGALRPSLRPLRRAVGATVRGRTRTRTNFTIDKNNFAPRAGAVVGGRFVSAHRRPRLDRSDVRAAAARLLRQRDPEQRRSGELHGADRRQPARARRRFRPASQTCRPASSCRDRASTPWIPTSSTQSAWLSNVQVERALRTDMAVSVGYVNSIGRNLPVLMDINLIPTGQTLAGRPSDLLDRGQRGDARRSDVQPREHVRVDRRLDLQRVHRHADQAHDARVAGAGDLHARARRRQRAAHRHLRRRQRRRSGVGSVQSGPRQRGDAVQSDAHVCGVDRDRAAGRGQPRRRRDHQQQPARRDRAGEQRPAVQHPVAPSI